MAINQAKIQEHAELQILRTANMLVPYYLIFSFAYYHLNESLVSDEFYDSICKQLLDEMEQFNVEHEHIHLIDPAALKAGTAFHLKFDDYPGRARGAATRFALGLDP